MNDLVTSPAYEDIDDMRRIRELAPQVGLPRPFREFMGIIGKTLNVTPERAEEGFWKLYDAYFFNLTHDHQVVIRNVSLVQR